jgi:hypothetical protein
VTRAYRPCLPLRMISLILIVALASGSMGCASANTNASKRARTQRLPPPNGIVVYDFETTAKSIGLGSGRDTNENGRRLTNEDIRNRKEVARVLADVLAAELEDRGIVTSRQSGEVVVPQGLMAVGGQIVTVEEGSTLKRVFIGFGSGKSQLSSVAQLYGHTQQGPTQLFEYQNTAASGSKPGVLTTLPIGVAVQGLTVAVLLLNGGLSTMGELSSVSTANAKRMGKELADAIEETLEKVTR